MTVTLNTIQPQTNFSNNVKKHLRNVPWTVGLHCALNVTKIILTLKDQKSVEASLLKIVQKTIDGTFKETALVIGVDSVAEGIKRYVPSRSHHIPSLEKSCFAVVILTGASKSASKMIRNTANSCVKAALRTLSVNVSERIAEKTGISNSFTLGFLGGTLLGCLETIKKSLS